MIKTIFVMAEWPLREISLWVSNQIDIVVRQIFTFLFFLFFFNSSKVHCSVPLNSNFCLSSVNKYLLLTKISYTILISEKLKPPSYELLKGENNNIKYLDEGNIKDIKMCLVYATTGTGSSCNTIHH